MSANKPKPTPDKPAAKPKPEAKSVSVPVTISDSPKPEKPSPVKLAAKVKPKSSLPISVSEAPKPGRETIYVDNDDEITAIIDKLEAAKSEEVALVLPKRSQVLQSIVNMRLLKRSAEEATKKVVLVTNEAAVIPLAGAAGVSVAKNLQSKPYIPASPIPVKSAVPVAGAGALANADELDEKDATLDYHRSMGELAVNEETDEPEKINLAEDAAATGAAGAMSKATEPAKNAIKAVKNKKLKVPNFDRFRVSMSLLIVGVVGLIIFLFLAVKVLPKATINIQTTGTPISANFTLNTSDKATAVDPAKMVIPATLQTKDQISSQSVQATGTQNNGTPATGNITMTAQDCTAPFSAPDVSSGTVVAAANGAKYTTQEPTSFNITGAGSCVDYTAKKSTSIKATTGGSNANVSSGTSFTINGRSDASATGSASGGTDANVTVVAQADIDKAKASVTSQSSDAFSKDFQSKLTNQNLYIIAPTLKVSDPQINATPGVGQPASTVSVSIKITYSVLTVKKDDLKSVVSSELKKKIDSSKQQILDSDVLKNVTISVQNQTAPAIATLTVTVDASATPNIDTEAIKKQSAGKKAGEIRDSVGGVTGVKSVDVKMSPFWVSTVPAKKIKVNLQQVTSASQSQSTTTNAQP